MPNVIVIQSKDPPEIVKLRLERAVRNFMAAAQKEKAPTSAKTQSA